MDYQSKTNPEIILTDCKERYYKTRPDKTKTKPGCLEMWIKHLEFKQTLKASYAYFHQEINKAFMNSWLN